MSELRHHLIWLITSRCQLDCVHCYAKQVNGEELTGEQVSQLARELGSELGHRFCSVGLTGGEPLLHPGTEAVVRILREHSVHVSVHTNGYLLDQRWLGLFAELGVMVYFSVDGFADGEDVRPASFLKHILSCMKRTAQAGVCFGTMSTIHAGNYGVLARAVEIASRYGAELASFLPLMPTGKATNISDLIPAPEQVRVAVEVIIEAAEAHQLPAVMFCMPSLVGEVKSRWVTAMGCGDFGFDLLPDGSLGLCDVYPVRVASVSECGSLARAFEEARRHEATRQWQRVICRDCQRSGQCSGICPARVKLFERHMGLNYDGCCPLHVSVCGSDARRRCFSTQESAG